MKKRELELYVHIPFCVRKCAYCDFSLSPCRRERNTCLYRGSDPGDQVERGKLQRLPYQYGISGRGYSFHVKRGGHRPDFSCSAGKL